MLFLIQMANVYLLLCSCAECGVVNVVCCGVSLLSLLGACCFVMQVVYHLCQHLTASKPTTLEDDIESLQHMQNIRLQNEHHTLALQFRIGKKQLLQSCLWQYNPQQLSQG